MRSQLIVFVLCSGCQVVTDEILDSYKKVDDGLNAVNDTLDRHTLRGRARICQEMLQRADGVLKHRDAVIAHLDSLHECLGGEAALRRTDLADSALAAFGFSDRTYHLLGSFFDDVGSLAVGDSAKALIADGHRAIFKGRDPETWRQELFFHMPKAAEYVVITKFQTDVTAAANDCITSLAAACDRQPQ